MNLLDLIPDPDEPDPKKLARATDPATSHRAADEVSEHLGDLQRWAAKCVTESPGLTQRELGVKYCPTDLRKIGRRLNECEKSGLVRRGKARKCSVSGRMAETWWPVEPQAEAA